MIKITRGQYFRTKEHRLKISAKMKGRKLSVEHRIKLRGRTGSKNPAYKGGTVVYTNGYVCIRGQKTKIAEHRYIMEKYLERKLNRWEEVHHLDGNKTNNKLENLFLLDKKNHSRQHYELFVKVQRLEWENKWLKQQIENIKKQEHLITIN